MDGAPATPFVRRAATLPSAFHPTAARPSTARQDRQSANLQSETLFESSSCKIYSFPADLARLNSSAAPGTREAAKLPWTNPHERVRAAGPVRVYRLPGSVCFLNSGDLLLSLMPRSQCWCVDGVSKFAIKVKMEIYRIELPTETDNDSATVDYFKDVLSKIIQFEKTACPFQRGFGHDLPEDTTELARSRPRGPVTQARKWVSDAGWRPEDMAPEEWRARNLRRASPGVSDDGSRTSGTTDENNTTNGIPVPLPTTPSGDDGPQIKSLGAGAYRSFTMPHKYNFNHGDPFTLSQQRSDASPEEPTSASNARAPRVFVQSPAEKVTVAERVNGLSSIQGDVASATFRPSSSSHGNSPGPVERSSKVVETPLMNGSEAANDSAGLPEVHEAAARPSTTKLPVSEISERIDTPEIVSDAGIITAETNHLDIIDDPMDEQTAQASAGSLEQPVIQQLKVKQVKIEEPVTPVSSALSEEVNVMDDVTEALEKHSLKTAESVQSFHTTRTGLSPKPSYASFKPTLETIEADAQEIEETHDIEEADAQEVQDTHDIEESDEIEEGNGSNEVYTSLQEEGQEMPIATASLATPTKDAKVPESPPSASPAEAPATAPRERRLRALHPKQSQSLMSSQALRRQSSISFTNRDGEPTDVSGELISKTISLLTGPPSGLLAVMVQIAAQIARGAFGPETAAFRYREGKTRKDGYKWMPGGWESDDEWDEDEGRDEVTLLRDDEDDYGVPLGCDTPSRIRRKEWGKGLVGRTDDSRS